MHKLLWLIPLAIIAAAIWVVTLIPTTVLAWIGGTVLVLAVGGAIGVLILASLAAAMKS